MGENLNSLLNEIITILGKVVITPKGEYDATFDYDSLDAVSLNGSSYLAKKPSTNVPVTNTEYWLELAHKGNTGDAAGFGTPTAEVEQLDPDEEPTVAVTSSGTDIAKIFNFAFGIPKGEKGDTGNGIQSFEKTGTAGKVDTYTFTFTDGTTATLTVTNGTNGSSAGFGTPEIEVDDEIGTPNAEIEASGPDTAKKFKFIFHNLKGVKGDDGVSPEVTIEEIEGGHSVKITDAEHPDGQTFNVMDGQDGASDAGEVTYAPEETYASGTVGAALTAQSSRIALLEDWHKDDLTYEQIQQIVRAGAAKRYFKIGDQINVKYTATNGTEYSMPFDVVSFEEVELENGDVVPSMIVQSHYATLESIQFDAAETSRPASEDYSGRIASYGYNRWSQSAYRQWLNSAEEKENWWTAQNDYDEPPTQLATVNGFMRGIDPEFLAILKPIKVETCLNYRYPSGSSSVYEYDTTYDTFFLPSKEQEYTVVNEPNHREGKAWQYWIDRLTPEATELGEPLPQANYASADVPHILTSHIRYALENHNSAQACRLRSATRNSAFNVWYVNSMGYVYITNASTAYRCAPACAIC